MGKAIAWTLLVALLGGGLHAGLTARYFKDKTEEQIAKDFEGQIPVFYGALLQDAKTRPAMHVTVKKQEVYAQLKAIKGDTWTLVQLVKYNWFPTAFAFNYAPFEPEYNLKFAELSPKELAYNYDVTKLPPDIIIGLAVWLASKGDLWTANTKAAGIVYRYPDLKDDIEKWICEKHGWKWPEKGMTYVATHNLETQYDSLFAVTPEANATRLAELDKEAVAALKKLEDLRGDIKGDFGKRRKAPGERLDILRNRVSRFEKAFANTPFVQDKKNLDRLKALGDSIDADVEEIKKRGFKAERAEIDGDFADAAKQYDLLSAVDPRNHDLLFKAATNWQKAGNATDAGRRCDDPDSMKKAAERFDKLAVEFPIAYSYRSNAGAAYRAMGDLKKAKARFEEILRIAPEGDENRNYAKTILSRMK